VAEAGTERVFADIRPSKQKEGGKDDV